MEVGRGLQGVMKAKYGEEAKLPVRKLPEELTKKKIETEKKSIIGGYFTASQTKKLLV